MSDIEGTVKETDSQESAPLSLEEANNGVENLKEDQRNEEEQDNVVESMEEPVQGPPTADVNVEDKTTPNRDEFTQEEQARLIAEENKVNLQIDKITPPSLPSRGASAVESTEISSPKLPPRQTEEEVPNGTGLRPPPPPPPTARRASDALDQESQDLLPVTSADIIQNRLFQMVRELKFHGKFKEKPDPDTVKEFANDNTIWAEVIRNPVETLSKMDRYTIEEQLIQGIEAKYRAALWTSVSFSYCHNWEVIYNALPHDIATTGSQAEIIEEELRKSDWVPEDKQSEIYRILSAYLALDSDVAYDTSLIGIIMAIYGVFNDELKTFAIFATLMKSYGYSKLYQEKDDELSVLMYQFDRLLEENCHDLYEYMAIKGIQSSTFTKEWFLTCFASDIPLECVRRVLDVVFLEGIECLLKFALGVLLQNEEVLLTLNFEALLAHLRERLFRVYMKSSIDGTPGTVMKGESVSEDSLLPMTSENFNVRALMEDALKGTRITPGVLKRYYGEFVEIHRSERNQEKQFEMITSKNLELQSNVRELEQQYTLLNREHVTIANELLQNQLKVESVQNENTDLKIEILNLRRRLEQDIRENKARFNVDLPGDIQRDIDKILRKNAKVMQENSLLQDKVSDLETIVSKIKEATEQGVLFEPEDESSSAKETFKAGWSGFKNVFRSSSDDRKASL